MVGTVTLMWPRKRWRVRPGEQELMVTVPLTRTRSDSVHTLSKCVSSGSLRSAPMRLRGGVGQRRPKKASV